MKILLTGAAGFIGMHVAKDLLNRGDHVVGVDNLNDYYDVNLKQERLKNINSFKNFKFIKLGVECRESMDAIFEKEKPERVIHLAAQAGVRYSIKNPHAYIESNVLGFMNILEGCRKNSVEHLVYASSSSVYGGNTDMPFSEHQNVDHPLSLYAATKKANELMAHTYSHLFRLPTTGLRFFTVYGPWGRPDMALFLFTKAILENRPIDIFNNGNMTRDFTYIEDVSESVIRVLDKVATVNTNYNESRPDPSTSNSPYRIFNVGNSRPTPIMEYIEALETSLNIKAKKNFMPMQAGDVVSTSADNSELSAWLGFKPNFSIQEGVREFVSWYQSYQGKAKLIDEL